jgi:hypothetical protein
MILGRLPRHSWRQTGLILISSTALFACATPRILTVDSARLGQEILGKDLALRWDSAQYDGAALRFRLLVSPRILFDHHTITKLPCHLDWPHLQGEVFDCDTRRQVFSGMDLELPVGSREAKCTVDLVSDEWYGREENSAVSMKASGPKCVYGVYTFTEPSGAEIHFQVGPISQ